MRIWPSKCFLDLKDIYNSLLNLFFIYFPIQIKAESDDTNTVRKLSFVVWNSRAKRFKLQKATSGAGFLGDDMVRDVSLYGPFRVAWAGFWFHMLEFMQKSHFYHTEKRRDIPRKHKERLIAKALHFVGELYDKHGFSCLGMWAWYVSHIVSPASHQTVNSLRRGPCFC